MAKEKRLRIERPNLILCEGQDAYWFLIWYLNSEELADIPFFRDEIQVIDFGGNEQLCDQITLLKNMDGFHTVRSILVIRDAERNALSAENQIKGAFERNGLPVPKNAHCWTNGAIKTGYLLWPTCSETVTEGTLEDFCLSILSEEKGNEILGEIDRFMTVLTDDHERTFPHEFKTKLHTYFSVTDRFVSLKIGEAAKAGAFNWNNDNLISLKEFLEELNLCH